jgi:hypothetical protein
MHIMLKPSDISGYRSLAYIFNRRFSLLLLYSWVERAYSVFVLFNVVHVIYLRLFCLVTHVFFDKIKCLVVHGLWVIIQALLRVYAVWHYLFQDLDVLLLFRNLIHNFYFILCRNLNCIAMLVQLNLRSLRCQISSACNSRTNINALNPLSSHL